MLIKNLRDYFYQHFFLHLWKVLFLPIFQLSDDELFPIIRRLHLMVNSNISNNKRIRIQFFR